MLKRLTRKEKRDTKKVAERALEKKKVSEHVLNYARLSYRKRLVTNYVLIPAFFFFISYICFDKTSSVVAATTFLISFFVLGFCLLAHHCERIRKDERPTREDYGIAADVMQFLSYAAVIITIVASGLIALFA